MEGQPAPELVSREWLGSKAQSLSVFRGRPVVLSFWAHSCDDSRTEARVLARIRKQFGPVGLTLWARLADTVILTNRGEPSGQAGRQDIKQILDIFTASHV